MPVDEWARRGVNKRMKSLLLLSFALGLALTCAGCARFYNVQLNNGQVITSRGKPHYDKANSVFTFTDALGQPRRVPAGSVRSVAPASDKADNPGFNPKPSR